MPAHESSTEQGSTPTNATTEQVYSCAGGIKGPWTSPRPQAANGSCRPVLVETFALFETKSFLCLKRELEPS